jgi:predicted ATPase
MEELVRVMRHRISLGESWLSLKVHQILPISRQSEVKFWLDALDKEAAHREYLTSRVHYLGPLRAHSLSEQVHRPPVSNLAPIGTRGEWLAYQLESPKNKRLTMYPLPQEFQANGRTVPMSLRSAVEIWSKWFEFGGDLKTKDEGVFGSFLELDSEKFHQKGTGISQVLPVIAISLLAEPGSTVLIEQPELHLHPAVQQKLGTFFSEMSKSGRRFVIETHSEYLVTRVRREVAVKSLKPENVALTFVSTETSEKNHRRTVYEQVPITPSGVLPRWPQGFYDFTVDDRMDIFDATQNLDDSDFGQSR